MQIKRAELVSHIQQARDEAYREARSEYPCVRSRGLQLVTIVDGEKADEVELKSPLVLSQIHKFIKLDCEQYQGHIEWSIEGGYDGADSVRDLNDFAYDPIVSEWCVELQVNDQLDVVGCFIWQEGERS